jgi:asparagine synthetase B (glutamine-hydrolysing)
MVELCYESGTGGSTMSRQLKVRKPNVTEMRQLRQTLEESTNARLCRGAEALLFYGAGLDAKLIADALAVHVNTIYTCLHRFARGDCIPSAPSTSRRSGAHHSGTGG